MHAGDAAKLTGEKALRASVSEGRRGTGTPAPPPTPAALPVLLLLLLERCSGSGIACGAGERVVRTVSGGSRSAEATDRSYVRNALRVLNDKI